MLKNTFTSKIIAKTTKPLTFLYGGTGIKEPLTNKLTMLIRVDDQGEPISLTTKSSQQSEPYDVGKLLPGEMIAVPLNQLVSISAEAENDSLVEIAFLN